LTTPVQKPKLQLIRPNLSTLGPKRGLATKTELELCLSEYLVAARQEGLSVRTLEQYRWHLDRLAAWLSERGVTGPGDLDKALLREWGASLYDAWSPATVKQAISSARAWLGWCYKERLIAAELRLALKVPQVKAQAKRTLWPEEVQRLMAVCAPTTDSGRRDLAIVALLTDSGLRAAEACGLRVSALTFDVQLPGIEGLVRPAHGRLSQSLAGHAPGLAALTEARRSGNRLYLVGRQYARPTVDDARSAAGGAAAR
jgi:integrase